jgi:hypothetical protein
LRGIALGEGRKPGKKWRREEEEGQESKEKQRTTTIIKRML